MILLELHRLEELNPIIRTRFFQRVFTPGELESTKKSIPSLAGLFCVKEAVSKALGCGIGDVSWQDIETVYNQQGAPSIMLYNNAARLADSLGLTTWAVSISHTHQVASASVTAIGFTDG